MNDKLCGTALHNICAAQSVKLRQASAQERGGNEHCNAPARRRAGPPTPAPRGRRRGHRGDLRAARPGKRLQTNVRMMCAMPNNSFMERRGPRQKHDEGRKVEKGGGVTQAC